MEDNYFDNKTLACSTILDVLNEDCWRLILDKLHVIDILQSERVSRKWQHIIFQYLQGAHLSVEYPNYKETATNHIRCLLMSEDDPESLDRIIRKWGTFVRKMDCVAKVVHGDGLKDLGKHCPNLEDVTVKINTTYLVSVTNNKPLDVLDVTLRPWSREDCKKEIIVLCTSLVDLDVTSQEDFYGLKDDVLLNKHPEHFKQLKRINFHKCKNVTDECVSLWLTDTIEELTIEDTKRLTGLCLTTLHSNLNTLSLKRCKALESRYLLSNIDHLTLLKKLELIFLPNEIFQNAHRVIDRTAVLEDLSLGWSETIELGGELVEAVARLGLRRLDLSFNMNANDEWLEVIARSCRLEELLVERCLDVTGRGVLAVCRASESKLRSLHVGSSKSIGNRDVVAFITACPNLASVNLSYNYCVSEDLVDSVGAVGRPLLLQVESTMIEGHNLELYPWLELDFGPPGFRDNDSSSS